MLKVPNEVYSLIQLTCQIKNELDKNRDLLALDPKQQKILRELIGFDIPDIQRKIMMLGGNV